MERGSSKCIGGDSQGIYIIFSRSLPLNHKFQAEKSGGDPQTLQKVTVNYLKKGRVNSDNESSTTAYYSKDEVTGPLKTAEGKNGKEDFVVKQGKVLVDEEGPNTIQKSLKEKTK
jgi:hypothetical protein